MACIPEQVYAATLKSSKNNNFFRIARSWHDMQVIAHTRGITCADQQKGRLGRAMKNPP